MSTMFMPTGMSFMTLPPEVRNLIYDYAFLPVRVLIAMSDEPDPADRRLGHHLAKKDGRNGVRASKNLLLTCRDVYAETKPYLYARTAFCFDSPDTFTAFLHRTPAEMCSTIEKVEFVQSFDAADKDTQSWFDKEMEDTKWRAVYFETQKTMTALTQLTLSATFFDRRLTYEPHTPEHQWIKGWKCSFTRPYDRVVVNIGPVPTHRPNAAARHVDRCRRLADGLMTKKNRKARDVEENKRALALVKAAKKPLPVIVLKLDGMTHTTADKPITRTVGLEGYTRVWSDY